jgi:hypothetical protein
MWFLHIFFYNIQLHILLSIARLHQGGPRFRGDDIRHFRGDDVPYRGDDVLSTQPNALHLLDVVISFIIKWIRHQFIGKRFFQITDGVFNRMLGCKA